MCGGSPCASCSKNYSDDSSCGGYRCPPPCLPPPAGGGSCGPAYGWEWKKVFDYKTVIDEVIIEKTGYRKEHYVEKWCECMTRCVCTEACVCGKRVCVKSCEVRKLTFTRNCFRWVPFTWQDKSKVPRQIKKARYVRRRIVIKPPVWITKTFTPCSFCKSTKGCDCASSKSGGNYAQE